MRIDDEQPVGLLSDREMSALLPPWRMKMRAAVARNVDREMPTLLWIQETCRTPALDVYFQWSSLLGSHTFFMLFVPIWFWFGYGSVGRGLIYVLAAGGYLTSVLKDLFCVARPYAPPLTRLSVGNHAHEYGFPSTHSTNSVSMALFFGGLIMRHSSHPVWVNGIAYALLTFFALTVTFGRLYTAMHSMLDVSVGSLIGALIWVSYWFLEGIIETWSLSAGWTVTATIVPATLFLVFVHPAPAEDCPCFEDAVAFVSVVGGIVLGRNWCHNDFRQATLGAAWETPLATSVWTSAVFAKVLIGVLGIFVWRLVAKEASHRALPPIFRFFAPLISLPRRHYVVATEYEGYQHGDGGLHPIPSILDLPSLDELEAIDISHGKSAAVEKGGGGNGGGGMRSRPNAAGAGVVDDPLERVKRGGLPSNKEKGFEEMSVGEEAEVAKKPPVETIRHDADVLTKVIVYSGIGWIATIGIPSAFEWVGLSA
ncbi:hypothetical protein RQP46_006766 [Phenoliferia psychrophenolica]